MADRIGKITEEPEGFFKQEDMESKRNTGEKAYALLSVQDVADRLGVSMQTVRNHVSAYSFVFSDKTKTDGHAKKLFNAQDVERIQEIAGLVAAKIMSRGEIRAFLCGKYGVEPKHIFTDSPSVSVKYEDLIQEASQRIEKRLVRTLEQNMDRLHTSLNVMCSSVREEKEESEKESITELKKKLAASELAIEKLLRALDDRNRMLHDKAQ